MAFVKVILLFPCAKRLHDNVLSVLAQLAVTVSFLEI